MGFKRRTDPKHARKKGYNLKFMSAHRKTLKKFGKRRGK